MLQSYRYSFGEDLGVSVFLRDKVHERFEDVCLPPSASRQRLAYEMKRGMTHSEHSDMAVTSLLAIVKLSRS